MDRWTKLEHELQKRYGESVTVDKIKPMHDEDFDSGYVVCVNNVIVANAYEDESVICEMIERYLGGKKQND